MRELVDVRILPKDLIPVQIDNVLKIKRLPDGMNWKI